MISLISEDTNFHDSHTCKSTCAWKAIACFFISALLALFACGCGNQESDDANSSNDGAQPERLDVQDKTDDEVKYVEPKVKDSSAAQASKSGDSTSQMKPVDIDIIEDYRKSFVHGDKSAQFQKYIMIHDTEGDGSPQSVVNYWDSNGNLVAAHFVIGKDGTIVQCVPLDKIAHHAGYGDTGHNEKFGITEDGRDDMKGTVPIGSAMSDYGMNAWSVGIELVHVGASGKDYPKAQLDALDKVIAHIDNHYGFQSKITDHKSWRTGNSDTSKEFAKYLKSYQEKRTYK